MCHCRRRLCQSARVWMCVCVYVCVLGLRPAAAVLPQSALGRLMCVWCCVVKPIRRRTRHRDGCVEAALSGRGERRRAPRGTRCPCVCVWCCHPATTNNQQFSIVLHALLIWRRTGDTAHGLRVPRTHTRARVCVCCGDANMHNAHAYVCMCACVKGCLLAGAVEAWGITPPLGHGDGGSTSGRDVCAHTHACISLGLPVAGRRGGRAVWVDVFGCGGLLASVMRRAWLNRACVPGPRR